MKFFNPITKILVSAGLIVVFFLSYNQFLIDKNLAILKLALAEVADATSPEQSNVQALSVLLDEAIKYAIMRPANLDNITALTVSQIAVGGKFDKQIDDVKIMLKQTVRHEEKYVGIAKSIVDGLVIALSDRAGALLHPSLPKKETESSKQEIDVIKEAINYAKTGRFQEAEQQLQSFIDRYPFSPWARTAKLFLASTYQQTGRLQEAEATYKELITKYFGSTEAKIAQRLLPTTDQRSLLRKKESLGAALNNPALSPVKQQKLYFDLATTCLMLGLFTEADENFVKGAELIDNELGLQARFNAAMAYKFAFQSELAIKRFNDIIEKYSQTPYSKYADAARIQIMSILFMEGRLEEAKQLAEQMTESNLTKYSAYMTYYYVYAVPLHEGVLSQAMIEESQKWYEKSQILPEHEKETYNKVTDILRNACIKCTDKCTEFFGRDLPKDKSIYKTRDFEKVTITIPQTWLNRKGIDFIGGDRGTTGCNQYWFDWKESGELNKTTILPNAKDVNEKTRCIAANTEYLVGSYVLTLEAPGISKVPAGSWQFHTYHYWDNAGVAGQVVYRVYKITSGVKTAIFTVTSADITATSPIEVVTNYTLSSAATLVPTDSLVVEVYLKSQVPGSTGHFVYDGATHPSHVIICLSTGKEQQLTKPFRITIRTRPIPVTIYLHKFMVSFQEQNRVDLTCSFEIKPFGFTWECQGFCVVTPDHDCDYDVRKATLLIWWPSITLDVTQFTRNLVKTALDNIRLRTLPYAVEYKSGLRVARTTSPESDREDSILIIHGVAHKILIDKLIQCLKWCKITDYEISWLFIRENLDPQADIDNELIDAIRKKCKAPLTQ